MKILMLIVSIILVSCSADSLDNSLWGDCKICNDFRGSDAVLEICDNGDNTVTIIVSISSGVNVFNEIVNIEDSGGFSNVSCSDFDDIDF